MRSLQKNNVMKRKLDNVENSIVITDNLNSLSNGQKKYCHNNIVKKPALPIEDVLNSEALIILKNLLNLSDVNNHTHPVCDFLTEPLVCLLKELMNKTFKNGLIILYGSGNNGKSCFTMILKKLFTSMNMPCDLLTSKNIEFYKKILKSTKPELIFVQELDDQTINSYINEMNLQKINSLQIPVIVVTNELPEINKINKMKGINVFEFKNIYQN